MNPTPVVFLFADAPSRDAFFASPDASALFAIAPSRSLIVRNAAMYRTVLNDCAHDFYCKTIIAVGKVFSDTYSGFSQKMPEIDVDVPGEDALSPGCLRLHHDTHLLVIAQPEDLSAVTTILQDYYALSDGHALRRLSREIGQLLTARHETIASAESCSGGLIVKTLTDVAGSSTYVAGGACTYTAAAKNHVLGVPLETIARHGIVSPETASAMALGAQKLYATNVALSTTGVAGPGPDGDGNPEGLVYIGVCCNDRIEAYKYSAALHTRLLDRDVIRKGCVQSALQTLLNLLKEEESATAK